MRPPSDEGDFVTSLDGRIALRDPASDESYLPEALTSTSDLRLLLELHAQADCLITHGGYLRAIARRRLDDILQVGTLPDHQDLASWRKAHGLRPQPAICIASASLDFPFPDSVRRHQQQVFIATGRQTDAARRHQLEREGCEVVIAGEGSYVEGRPLVAALAQRGLRSAFLLSGPRMLETMMRDGVWLMPPLGEIAVTRGPVWSITRPFRVWVAVLPARSLVEIATV